MKPSSQTWGLAIVGACLLTTQGLHAETVSSLAPNPVVGVDIRNADDATRVVIQTQRAPKFSVFKLSAPTRVVIDVQDAVVSGVASPVSGAGLVRSVTTAQFDDSQGRIGRLIVELADGARYDVTAQGASVVVLATPALPVTQAEAMPTLSSSKMAAGPAKGVAHPATRLLSMSSKKADGAVLLSFKTDGEPLRYEVKEVPNPPRLVVDLYGIKTALRKDQAIHDDNLKKMRIGRHADKTRVVIDTRKGIPEYDVAVSDEGLTLAVTPRLAQQPLAAQASVQGHTQAQVKNVSFAKKADFWRLRVDVDGAFSERLASDAPRMKIVEFQAQLPEALARTLDATDLGGPVRRISTFVDPEKPGTVRLAADLRDPAESKMWRKGNSLYWDFKAAAAPAPVAPAAAGLSTQVATSQISMAAAKRYSGKRITIDVKDADILNVLRLIADVSKLNVVASDDVRGKVTMKLRDVPWDQALEEILKVKGLGQVRRGRIIRVAPAAKLQEEQELKAKKRQLEQISVPTTVKLLVVNYASAKEMLPQVEKLLSKRGSASVDARTNVIIVEDIRENLIQAERLVRTLDTQTPQVLIETRIVEASTSFVRDLGIQWGGGLNFSSMNGNPTGLAFPSNVGILGGATDPAAAAAGGEIMPSNYAVNMPAESAGGIGSSALGMNFGSIGNAGSLNLRITAAETEGQAKVVSAPKVVTIDNKTARISQGVDIPVMTVSAAGTQTQLITAALELEVTPHVTTDGSILLKIHVTNNVPNFQDKVGGVPSIDKKEADTEVLLYDGDTSVIGGIYTRRYAESYKYTPLLGKIPVLGWLFKSSYKSDDRKELLGC